ncbi:MAG: sugar phosphate isomerase/epimerase [Ruminococcaceae bacterium]|nr:sugar phosphate isomerase/epimerase [Oscillospiraceae bacterium]
MKIGVQFYTLRNQCATLEGLEDSMKKVADMGYKHIQLSGVCVYDPQWMSEKLKETGLSCEITHYSYDKIVGKIEDTIAFHDTIECKWIGIGSNPKGATPEGLAAMVSDLRPSIEKIVASGHKFMYHNHHMELARFEGKTFLDLLCDAFTPEECGVTLDTYWIQAGGGDPAWWLRKLKGRVDCIHFKDMVYSPVDRGVRMAPIGKGNMNYADILRACDDANVQYAFIEQDNCYEEDPFSCLKQSYDYLKAQGMNF